jgi:hypothetical protein
MVLWLDLYSILGPGCAGIGRATQDGYGELPICCPTIAVRSRAEREPFGKRAGGLSENPDAMGVDAGARWSQKGGE